MSVSGMRRRLRISHWASSTRGFGTKLFFCTYNFEFDWQKVRQKVQTVAYPAVRLVNKSRDARKCVLNEPAYAICAIFTTLLYYKILGLNLCDLVWQIRHNYKRLDDGHCGVTGHRKMSVLGAVGTMVTTHENFVLM